MPKIVIWSVEDAKKNLQERLRASVYARKEFERAWRINEQTVYNTTGHGPSSTDSQYDIGNYMGISDDASVAESGQVVINYSFKNLRFLHAQLAANPPSVVPRPTSNDAEDRRKADAADRVVRYGIKQYNIQECVDKATLNTLLYGSGLIKTYWDASLGDILDIAEETGEMTMEGDFRLYTPSPWNIFIDSDADVWEDVRFVFEKILVPWEEALYRWPEKVEILQKHRLKGEPGQSQDGSGDKSAILNRKNDVVELYEYWEKGLPSNGFLGRWCLCTREGDLISKLTQNPERFKPSRRGKNEAPKYEVATLPYHMLTDIDVPARVWGKSFVEYEANLQDLMNRLDTAFLDNVRAHGVARLVIYDNSEVNTDSITDNPMDIIKVTGGGTKPDYINPMALPPAMMQLLDRYRMGIDDMAGVNESMFGQQSREQSGFSMQYATNQGNMIRFRLLNKYRGFVESIYKSYLKIAQKHWTIPRTIQVLGKEKALESIDIKNTDLDGGYDIVADYGASLSLDPTTRREEMLTLLPLFEKSGVEPRKLLKMLKLNELAGEYDLLDLAADRQREIFEQMKVTGQYIPPEELQDDKNMLLYAYEYVMTAEFKYLDERTKALIRQHIKDREMRAAAGAQVPGEGGPQAMAGAAPGALAGLDAAAAMAPEAPAVVVPPPM